MLAFADPVFDSQTAFRAVLDAMARPGRIVACGEALTPPPPLARAAAATLLALVDFETALWIAPDFPARAGIADYLTFYTGARLASAPYAGAFALALAGAAPLDLAEFAQGTADYPDRSTTLILQVDTLEAGPKLKLCGPGIKGEAALSLSPLPAGLIDALAANRAAFPRGVDLILAAEARLAALPRSTRVEGGL